MVLIHRLQFVMAALKNGSHHHRSAPLVGDPQFLNARTTPDVATLPTKTRDELCCHMLDPEQLLRGESTYELTHENSLHRNLTFSYF